MFITRKSLPRRTLLKGMGATLALPFLDAMVPALSPRLKAATGPRRAAFIYFSNGTVIEHWTPATTGKGVAYPTILKPFEPHRSSAVVVTGLGNKVEGTHPTASSGWLTGVSAKPTEGDDVYNNTSIDQVIAARVGSETLLPSLEVATEDFSSAIGSCAGGYSCIYANTISWRTPTMPLPMEINPRRRSNGCSVGRVRQRNARRAYGGRRAFSTASAARSASSRAASALATSSGSTSTCSTCARWKGRSRRRRSRAPSTPTPPRRRSASPSRIMTT